MRRLRLLLALSALLAGADLLACTTAIVSAQASATGRPLIWKQRDADNIRNCLSFRKGLLYDFTAIVPVSAKSKEASYGGINTVGFAIANNLSYNLNDDDGASPRNGLFMQLALGQCRTLADFEQLLAERPDSIRIGANFAVIDAEGGAAYYEAGVKGWQRFDVPRGGVLYRTNFSLSGRKDEGGGYARYEAIRKLMDKVPAGGFGVDFFLRTSRLFYDGINGRDALKGSRRYLYDRDFIPRTSSASSVVIEGVVPGDRPDAGMMWFVPGYPPCSYAVAAWVAAGERMPACISGDAPANAFAGELMRRTHPFPWSGGDNFLDTRLLKTFLPKVRRAEAAERKAAGEVDRLLRSGPFDPEAVLRYNTEADARFDSFRTSLLP